MEVNINNSNIKNIKINQENNIEINSDEEFFNQINHVSKEKIQLDKLNLIDNPDKVATEDVSEKLHLSLILDDENKLSLDIFPTDNIESICLEICKSNNLDELIAKKLKKKIEQQIIIFKSEKENNTKVKEQQIVNRLYTEAVKRKILKDKYFEKIKNDLEEKEMNNYSFTPKISQNSNIMYNRSHLKIEDKLFYEEMKKREKKNFIRIINDVNKKELVESKIIGSHIKSESI